MREATKQFFLKPYVTQFIVMVLVVVPIVEGVLSTSLKSMREHFLTPFMFSQITIIVGIAITVSIKFFFSRPVIRYVENPGPDDALTKQALLSASRMPLAEGVGIYCIWRFATALMIAPPMHMKGLIPLPELLFMMNVYTMCALTSMKFFYLTAYRIPPGVHLPEHPHGHRPQDPADRTRPHHRPDRDHDISERIPPHDRPFAVRERHVLHAHGHGQGRPGEAPVDKRPGFDYDS